MMRVLYVEDDPMNRSVVKDMLSVVGAEMTEAVDAEAGLAILDAEPFNIILMDLRMPGMDGITAIGHIRRRNDAKGQLPVIVVTADMSHDLRQRCMASGADEVLQKPVAMGALLKTMTAMLTKPSGGPRAMVA
jgi:CheY-like chemotaxis protein